MTNENTISSFYSTMTINRLTEEQYQSLDDSYFDENNTATKYHNFEFYITEDDSEGGGGKSSEHIKCTKAEYDAMIHDPEKIYCVTDEDVDTASKEYIDGKISSLSVEFNQSINQLKQQLENKISEINVKIGEINSYIEDQKNKTLLYVNTSK